MSKKKKGGRVTEKLCPHRSFHNGRRLPCAFTNRKRVRDPETGEWSDWEVRCCGCSKLRGPALPDTLMPVLEAARREMADGYNPDTGRYDG